MRNKVIVLLLALSLFGCDESQPMPIPKHPTGTPLAMLQPTSTSAPAAPTHTQPAISLTATPRPTTTPTPSNTPTPQPSPAPTIFVPTPTVHEQEVAHQRSIRHSSNFFMVSKYNGWSSSWRGLEHWNGRTWVVQASRVVTLTSSTSSISYINESSIWLVRGGELSHWDGANLNVIAYDEQYKLNPWIDEQFSIVAFSNTDVWLVGSVYIPTGHEYEMVSIGIVQHWDGRNLTRYKLPIQIGFIASIAATSTSNIWAVASGGIILHYNGKSWQQVSSQTENDLSDVYLLSANYGWAIANPAITLHWDGKQWRNVPNQIPQSTQGDCGPATDHVYYIPTRMNNIWMISNTEGWLTGWFSTGETHGRCTWSFLARWDGKTWQVFSQQGVARGCQQDQPMPPYVYGESVRDLDEVRFCSEGSELHNNLSFFTNPLLSSTKLPPTHCLAYAIMSPAKQTKGRQYGKSRYHRHRLRGRNLRLRPDRQWRGNRGGAD